MKNNLKYFGVVFLLAFVFFAGGCGIETTYNVTSPIISGNEPTFDTIDQTRRYFSFSTNEVGAVSGAVRLLGTAVYYRIYNNINTLVSANAAIDSVNNSSTATTTATYQAITSRNYQELGMQGGAPRPVIEFADRNQHVEIRLTNYLETSNPEWAAAIKINGETIGIPRRTGDRYSFDFGRRDASDDTEVNRLPASGDDDYTSGTFTETGIYYVDAYALNIGYDETFSYQYSKLLHLGAIRIDSTMRDN